MGRGYRSLCVELGFLKYDTSFCMHLKLIHCYSLFNNSPAFKSLPFQLKLWMSENGYKELVNLDSLKPKWNVVAEIPFHWKWGLWCILDLERQLTKSTLWIVCGYVIRAVFPLAVGLSSLKGRANNIGILACYRCCTKRERRCLPHIWREKS